MNQPLWRRVHVESPGMTWRRRDCRRKFYIGGGPPCLSGSMRDLQARDRRFRSSVGMNLLWRCAPRQGLYPHVRSLDLGVSGARGAAGLYASQGLEMTYEWAGPVARGSLCESWVRWVSLRKIPDYKLPPVPLKIPKMLLFHLCSSPAFQMCSKTSSTVRIIIIPSPFISWSLWAENYISQIRIDTEISPCTSNTKTSQPPPTQEQHSLFLFLQLGDILMTSTDDAGNHWQQLCTISIALTPSY